MKKIFLLTVLCWFSCDEPENDFDEKSDFEDNSHCCACYRTGEPLDAYCQGGCC